MLILKLFPISGVTNDCRVTRPPVKSGLSADSSGTSLGLITFMGCSSIRWVNPAGQLLTWPLQNKITQATSQNLRKKFTFDVNGASIRLPAEPHLPQGSHRRECDCGTITGAGAHDQAIGSGPRDEESI